MDNDWASEHLQIIRTLMERSAVYRRALAPVMLTTGIVGIVGATIPCFFPRHSPREFGSFWMAVGVVAALQAFILVRRQALKDAEPFWSPPTRRVVQALLPAFVVGFVVCLVAILADRIRPSVQATTWIILYGLGINAAGFFVQRGIRLLGWIFVGIGLVLVMSLPFCRWLEQPEAGHYLMGGAFGALQLLYGVYLYFTEKARRTV